MLPANLGSVQEPTVVEVLPTSIWDTSDNMINSKIAKLKFDPRSTEDTTLPDFVINVTHCNSRQNLQSVCCLKCVLLCLKSVISHYALRPLKFPEVFMATSKVCINHVESCDTRKIRKIQNKSQPMKRPLRDVRASVLTGYIDGT